MGGVSANNLMQQCYLVLHDSLRSSTLERHQVRFAHINRQHLQSFRGLRTYDKGSCGALTLSCFITDRALLLTYYALYVCTMHGALCAVVHTVCRGAWDSFRDEKKPGQLVDKALFGIVPPVLRITDVVPTVFDCISMT